MLNVDVTKPALLPIAGHKINRIVYQKYITGVQLLCQ